MANQPSNPISVNQIVDTTLDLKCIKKPDCRTLPNDVQAIVDEYCTNKFDITKIILGCLTNLPANYTINDLFNKVIAKECSIVPGTNGVDFTTINLSGINFCLGDDWDTSKSNCLTLVDNCGNPIATYNIYDVFRALIRRIVSMEVVIKSLKTVNDAQQVQINTNTSQITNIINNCCNVTVLNSIQTINARLLAANIP